MRDVEETWSNYANSRSYLKNPKIIKLDSVVDQRIKKFIYNKVL